MWLLNFFSQMISYLKKHVSTESHDSLIFMESLSMLYISKNNAHLYNKDSLFNVLLLDSQKE